MLVKEIFTVFLYFKARQKYIRILNFQIFGIHIAVAVDQHKVYLLRIVATWFLLSSREADMFVVFGHVNGIPLDVNNPNKYLENK